MNAQIEVCWFVFNQKTVSKLPRSYSLSLRRHTHVPPTARLLTDDAYCAQKWQAQAEMTSFNLIADFTQLSHTFFQSVCLKYYLGLNSHWIFQVSAIKSEELGH